MDWIILHIEILLDINCSVDGLHNGHSMPYNKNMFDFFSSEFCHSFAVNNNNHTNLYIEENGVKVFPS